MCITFYIIVILVVIELFLLVHISIILKKYLLTISNARRFVLYVMD